MQMRHVAMRHAPALREASASLARFAASILAAFAAMSTSVQQWRIASEASRNSLSKELRTFPVAISHCRLCPQSLTYG